MGPLQSSTSLQPQTIKACESLTKLLAMKQATPAEYDAFIRDYGRK